MTDLLTTIGDTLTHVVVPGAVTALAAIAIPILTRQLARVGLELTAQQAARLNEIAQHAIAAAHELSRRDPMSGTEKRAYALSVMETNAPAGVSVLHMANALDAQLPLARQIIGDVTVPKKRRRRRLAHPA